MTAQELFQERAQLVQDAIELKEPKRVPICPFIGSVAQRFHGSSYRDLYYDFDKAGAAAVEFYKEHPQMDCFYTSTMTSGRSNEIAQSKMIDWPGRPGTKVSNYSSHQVMEFEFMEQDEYDELLRDYTGFMLKKYVPRAFPGLKGMENIGFRYATILNTAMFGPSASPEAVETYEKLEEIGKLDREAWAKTVEYQKKIMDLGFPPLFTGAAEAPLDILFDYFRGTMGMFDDLIEVEDKVEAAVELFTEHQIERLQYLRHAPMPIKRVFIPMHKGVDGFMSPDQYDRLYLKPLLRVVNELVDMGVTPYLYTEGRYNSRLEALRALPVGKCIVHLETTDAKRAKEILGDIACLSGNLPIYELEFGTKEKVIDYTKYLMDTLAPGGGYIFDCDGTIENAKPENLEAMFDTAVTYGKY